VNKQTRKSIARQYTPLERAMVYAEELAGDAPLRSYIRKVMANLPEITAWLDRLPEWRRTKLNNPQYVYQQWLEATGRKKERDEPTYADYEKSAAHEVVDLVAEHAIGDNDKQKIASARKILRLASKSLTSEAFAG